MNPPRGLKDPKDPKTKATPPKRYGCRASEELVAQACETRDLRSFSAIAKGAAVPKSFATQAAFVAIRKLGPIVVCERTE